MSACNPYSCAKHFYIDTISEEDWAILAKSEASAEILGFVDLDDISAMWVTWNNEVTPAKPKGWLIQLKSGKEVTFSLSAGVKVYKALKRYKGEI